MSANEVVRQANGYDVDAASVAAGLLCEDESRAVQSQKDEADINVLVRRFGVTGVMPVRELPAALVGHVESFDLMEAHAVLLAARDSFDSLDADLRFRFGNDPMRFVAFAEAPENLPELRKLGLAKQEVVVEPEKVQKVEIVNERGEGFRDVAGDAGESSRKTDRSARRDGRSARGRGVDD